MRRRRYYYLRLMDVFDIKVVTMKEVIELVNLIRNNLIALLVDFNKKQIEIVVGGNKRKYAIRDNIFYRMNSTIYHYNLLMKTKHNALGRISDLKNAQNKIILIQATEEVYFIFDDLIFNLISLFDYFGNLIGFLYFGEHKATLQWKGMKNGIKTSNEDLNKYIKYCNDSFVNNLYGYRSDILHFKKDYSESEHVMTFGGENTIKHAFNIAIPHQLKSRMKIDDSKEVDIIEIAYYLLLNSIKILNQIVELIAKDIIPKNKENMRRLIDEFDKKRAIIK